MAHGLSLNMQALMVSYLIEFASDHKNRARRRGAAAGKGGSKGKQASPNRGKLEAKEKRKRKIAEKSRKLNRKKFH